MATNVANGRVDLITDLMGEIRAEMGQMRAEHADYRTAAARREVQIDRLTGSVDQLAASVKDLAQRLQGVEARTGYLPTANRALAYLVTAGGGAAVALAANALLGL